MKKNIVLIALIILQWVSLSGLAQNVPSTEFDAMKTAYLNIKKEKYSEAYPYYRKMLDQYPKDPSYNYYSGVCLLYLEKNPTNALKQLRYASTRDVSIDVYFYLGMAYLKNYEFDKALDSFGWFEKRASKSRIKELKLKNYISNAQNGLFLVKYAKKPIVYSKETENKNTLYKKYIFPDLDGKFVERSDFFNQKRDSLAGNSVLYVPNQIEKNEVLYYSDVNKKRGDLDIFRITKINDTLWSQPENLGDIINTPFDDAFPYIHSNGTSLYFASKGHYSMGGYDIYQSVWNWSKQEWSEPENLDFPINSPFDDVLLVPSPNKKTALFASDRQTEGDVYQVYKIKFDNPEPYLEIKSHDELLKMAELKIEAIQDKKNEKDDRYKSGSDEIVKIKSNGNIVFKTEYDSLLSFAIKYQLRADSLRWVIDDKRSVFDETENGQERAKIANQIIELERQIYGLQKKADSCYEQVRKIEQANLASQSTIYENVNKQDTQKAKVKLNEESKVQKMFVEPTENSLQKSKLENVILNDQELKSENVGLNVLIPSIYHAKNPIPINEKLPEGVIYLIQLGAFSTVKTPDIFNGLTPLSIIKADNSNINKYFAGKFYLLDDAEKSLPIAKSKGFKDAFIVAFNNGKTIQIKEAIKIEKKDTNIIHVAYQKQTDKSGNSTENLSIVYILKSELNTLDTVLMNKIKIEIAVDKDLRLDKSGMKSTLNIKSFSTFEEAYQMKKKIEAVLYEVIDIYAYFAESQMPIEQAKKMTK